VGVLLRRQLQSIQEEGDGTINCNVREIHCARPPFALCRSLFLQGVQ
jgi:hypothetical protein